MADFAADVVAEPDAISALSERATAFLAGEGVDARAAHHVALVIDELLTNLACHGGGAKTSACVRLTVRPDRVDAQVSDYGAQFDPRKTPDIDLSAFADNRPIGGLGLFLIHRVTERLDYERDGDCNRTMFSVRRTPAADV
jgi:anti-sigma regulatory factor (Ser/Thr protein kinase)